MSDYTKEMKALERLMEQEDINRSQASQDVGTGKTIAGIVSPLFGTGDTKSMEQAWTGGSQGRLDDSTARRKSLMDKYKMMGSLQGKQMDRSNKMEDARTLMREKAALDRQAMQNKPTKGQEAVDREFAKEYIKFKKGGAADVAKGLTELKITSAKLGEKGANLTGTAQGLTPDWMQSVVNPEALEVKQQIEQVVQRNLREVLGAQFTEKEGERLISRAYNPYLDEKTNKARIDRLIASIEKAYKAKSDMSKYYEQNGTLRGYSGEEPSLASIERDAQLNDGPQGNQQQNIAGTIDKGLDAAGNAIIPSAQAATGAPVDYNTMSDEQLDALYNQRINNAK